MKHGQCERCVELARERDASTARADRLRFELEKIGWMDEFLDAAGAKAMMEIARDAVSDDEERAALGAKP